MTSSCASSTPMTTAQSSTVPIAIVDINDNPPVFLHSPYVAYVMEEMGQLTMPVSITRVEAHHTDGTRATSWSVVQVSAFDGDDGETTSSDRDVDDEPQQNMQLAVAQPRQTTNESTNLVEYVKDIAKTKSIPIYTPCENGGVCMSTLRMWTKEPETMDYPMLILLGWNNNCGCKIGFSGPRCERTTTFACAGPIRNN